MYANFSGHTVCYTDLKVSVKCVYSMYSDGTKQSCHRTAVSSTAGHCINCTLSHWPHHRHRFAHYPCDNGTSWTCLCHRSRYRSQCFSYLTEYYIDVGLYNVLELFFLPMFSWTLNMI